jgi:hypothetical protein
MTDECDSVTDQPNVCIEPWIAGAIDDLPIADQGVVFLRRCGNGEKDLKSCKEDEDEQEFGFHESALRVATIAIANQVCQVTGLEGSKDGTS